MLRSVSMKHSLLPFLLLLVLLMPLFLLPSFGPAKAASPEVYILPDGSVQGTSSIQRNGDVYTLVGDVGGPLIVQKDNVVIDGAGHTLVGGNGRGIVLADRHDVTLKNTRVTLDGGYLIDVESATDCALIGNILIGTPQPIPGLPPPTSPLIGPIAINFLHSQNITVKDNAITNFFYALSLDASKGHTITGNTLIDGILGIAIENTSDCVFRNNNLRNCSFSVSTFGGGDLSNDLDSSNTVNGRPIYYWVNMKDRTVPSDATYIVLVKCANIAVKNASPKGVCIVSTVDSAISNVTLGRVTMNLLGDGINLLDSSRISITGSVVHDTGIGIRIENSSNIIVRGNDISNQITKGIDLVSAADTLISGNIFNNNNCGIGCTPYELSNGAVVGTSVVSNNFTGNGCAVNVCGGIEMCNNFFDSNEVGLMFSGYSGNTVTENVFSHNKNALYFSDSSGNSIYLNNFLENEHQVTDAGVNSTLTQPAKVSPSSSSMQLMASNVEGVNFLPPPPPSHNQYDNGSRGNYWIDYTGSDSNGDGIGDTAYYLYENNQDRYPLMNPLAIQPVQVPQVPEVPDGETTIVGGPSPSPSPSPQETESFPTAYSMGFVALIIAALLGLIVYILKRKH
jgi:parallel beta-helix repeat protein